MTTLSDMREAYAAAFGAYLADPSEPALQAAYELGRDAVARELSVLDLATAHHEVVRDALAHTSGAADAQRITDAAASFFLESLSAFEMLQRGFRESQEAARAEQRQAAMLRRLSTFLGDASLAFEEADSVEEVLQLVAEQARELIGAECCCAFAPLENTRIDALATDAASPWNEIADRTALYKLASLLTWGHGVTRLTEVELADDPAATALGALVGRPLRAVVAARLTALDGRRLGSFHLLDTQRASFGDVDEAQLLHLTQLASAAVERVTLYGRERRVADALERGRCKAGVPGVVLRRRHGDDAGAVWCETIARSDGRVAILAGEIRGPDAAVAAAQACSAAGALAAGDVAPADALAQLARLLERIAPDNPARAAVAVVGADGAEIAVDGRDPVVVPLGDGNAVVVHAGGGVPPAGRAVPGSPEEAVDGALAELPGDAEAAVLAADRRIVRPHP